MKKTTILTGILETQTPAAGDHGYGGGKRMHFTSGRDIRRHWWTLQTF